MDPLGEETDAAHIDDAAAAEPAGGARWRIYVGSGLLVLSLILPLIALLVLPLLGFPDGVNVVVFGLSVAGGPDLLLVAAAAVMGKENLQAVMDRFGPWLRRVLRWDSVSRRRYTVGLWVLTTGFLLPWVIAVFFEDSVVTSDNRPDWGYYVMVAGSIAFIGAFLAMGAPLWQRVRAIFTWDARISLGSAHKQS